MANNKPTFAIIGGGIGLFLGVSLHKGNINVVIYEAAGHFEDIGAGVAFTRNVVEAIQICDKGVYEAFSKVVSNNQWESKKNVWFDSLDRMKNAQAHQEAEFTMPSSMVMNGFHRAALLNEMVKLVEGQNLVHVGKRLEEIEHGKDGGW
jgi:salicylate hydroxylase